MSAALLVILECFAVQQYGVAPEEWARLGLRDGHQLGTSVAVIGDQDGDGRPDLLAGAPGTDYPAINYGSVYVLSSRDGRTLQRVDGTMRDGGFGRSTCRVGDQDGDGREDLFAGEDLFDPPGLYDSGRFAIHSSRTGAILLEITGTRGNEYLGCFASGGEDLDGDLHPDFVVCNQLYNNSKAYVFSGASLSPRFAISSPGDYFLDVSAVTDLSGDGLADVALLVWHDYLDIELRVHSGVTGSLLYSVRTPLVGERFSPIGDLDADGIGDLVSVVYSTSATIFSGANGSVIRTILNDRQFGGFGSAVEGLDDLNGDGLPDLAVGCFRHGTAQALDVGAVAIYSGADGQFLNLTMGSNAGDWFGSELANLGDLDGDGAGEWSVASRQVDNRGYADAGLVNVMSYRLGLRCQQRDLSASSGGNLEFLVNLGPTYAGRPYQVLASASGRGRFTLGVDVPLVLDDWVVRTLGMQYPPQINAQGFAGLLDDWGRADPRASIPASALSARVGATIAFAAIVYPALGAPLPEAASQAVEILVLP